MANKQGSKHNLKTDSFLLQFEVHIQPPHLHIFRAGGGGIAEEKPKSVGGGAWEHGGSIMPAQKSISYSYYGSDWVGN